jgi:hypothetical protein
MAGITTGVEKTSRPVALEHDFSRRLNIGKAKVMGKLMAIVALLAGLSACHAGIGIGDNDTPQARTYVASDAFGSAVAQASIGITGTAD